MHSDSASIILYVSPDSKVPFSNPHQIIEGEFDGESTVGADFGKRTFPVMRRHRRLVAVQRNRRIVE